jgi:CheY-like chemotaxis protein
MMNLVVNAQDAIVDKGTITIETTSVFLDEDFVANHPSTKIGSYIMLAVSDSGRGIDKDILDHIFEPFFTTKKVGEGTGLGLANVYGIVKQHEGTIWVYSEPGRGTVFKIYLPAIDETPFEEADPHSLIIDSKDVSGTILLVEDDETVRSFACELLVDLGYDVIETGQPSDAIKLFADNAIDLLVTDVIMPGMNGPELHDHLLKVHPGLRVLFMSGYTDNAISNHIELRDGRNFIQKPFTANDMARKVAALLAE